MKKYLLHIIFSMLIVLQIVSLIKISNLENQLEYAQINLSNQIDSVSRNVGNIYENVDEMLNKQASIIESAHSEIGKFNVSDLTVPITFTVTPKVVSKSTVVSLDFEGEQFYMDKNGTTYIATISRNIFDEAMPKVIIDENGVLKTEQPETLGIRSIKDKILPEMYTRLRGESTYGSEVYHRKGTLSIDMNPVSLGTKFTDIKLVIKVDDKVISDENISSFESSLEENIIEYEVDEKINLTDGQTCTMTVIATDNYGLCHHKIVDYWKAGSDEFMEDRWLDTESIYSADGELLWTRDI